MKRHVKLSTAIISVVLACVLVAGIMTALFYFTFGSTIKNTSEYSTVFEAIDIIKNKFIGDSDSSEMSDGAISGIVDSLGDKWSYYVPADEAGAYYDKLNNSYVGIGVTVSKEDGQDMLVVTVDPDGGAYAAGIVAGDYITAVDGEKIAPLSLSEAKTAVLGEEDSTVGITVRHESGETEEMQVERRRIETVPVEGELIGTVGYIRIKNFNAGTSDLFKSAVQNLIDEGAESLVFDVRFNGGGQLSELTPMLDYLLPEGKIFRATDKEGQESVVTSDANCVEMPMSVLVNDSTYSAAEYFAAALREYEWATVVGQQTTGKGYMQTTISLSDGSALVLSTKQYFTPKGEYLADVGITPDVEIDISEDDYYNLYLGELAQTDDAQLQAAIKEVSK